MPAPVAATIAILGRGRSGEGSAYGPQGSGLMNGPATGRSRPRRTPTGGALVS